MSSVNAAAQSIQSVNSLLVDISKKSMDASEKLMKYTVASSVGKEVGKGDQIDLSA